MQAQQYVIAVSYRGAPARALRFAGELSFATRLSRRRSGRAAANKFDYSDEELDALLAWLRHG